LIKQKTSLREITIDYFNRALGSRVQGSRGLLLLLATKQGYEIEAGEGLIHELTVDSVMDRTTRTEIRTGDYGKGLIHMMSTIDQHMETVRQTRREAHWAEASVKSTGAKSDIFKWIKYWAIGVLVLYIIFVYFGVKTTTT